MNVGDFNWYGSPSTPSPLPEAWDIEVKQISLQTIFPKDSHRKDREDWLRSELLLLLIALLNHCAIPARNKLYRYTKPF